MTMREYAPAASLSVRNGQGGMRIQIPLALRDRSNDKTRICATRHPPATQWDGPPLLNILRVTDIPEAAAVLAPHELVLLTPPQGWKFDYTAAIYRLTGNSKQFRKAGSLPTALEVWRQTRA